MEKKFEIIQEIGVLNAAGSWKLEVNLISWYGRPAKVDIRKWNSDHTECGKGMTLTEEEFERLKQLVI